MSNGYHETKSLDSPAVTARASKISMVGGTRCDRFSHAISHFFYLDRITSLRPCVVSCWEFMTPGRVLAFRLCAWIWSFGILLYDWAQQDDRALYLTYLTEWNQLSSFLYFSLALVVSTRYYSGGSRFLQLHGNSFPTKWLYFHAQHMFSWCFVVVVLFWATLYPDDTTKDTWAAPHYYFTNACVHGVVLFWAWMDMIFVTRVKFIASQWLVCLLISLIYMFFNLVYVKISGSPIYSTLSWDSSSSALVVVEAVILLAIVWFLIGHLLVNRLKARLMRGLADEDDEKGERIAIASP